MASPLFGMTKDRRKVRETIGISSTVGESTEDVNVTSYARYSDNSVVIL